MFIKKLDVGTVICDMHATGFDNRVLKEHFDVRNKVMFHLHTDYRNPFGQFHQFLGGVAGKGQGHYHNKYLVVIDRPWEYVQDEQGEGWWPCAFSYDNNYAGVCEIRLKKPA